MLALVFFLLIGAGSLMAKTFADDKKGKPLTGKKSEKPDKQKVHATVVWYYIGSENTLAAFKDGENWTTTNTGVCADQGPKPCQISAEATTQQELSAYLEPLTQNQILEMSSGRRN